MRESPTPSYCLHRPSRRAYVTVRVAGTRQAVYLGGYGDAASFGRYRDVLVAHGVPEPVAAAAADSARRLSRSPAAPVPGPPNPESEVTVFALYRAFLGWAEGYYRLPTGERSKEIDNFRYSFTDCLDSLGSMPTAGVTRKGVLAVRDRMAGRGLCRGVVNQRISRIVRVFRWGTEDDRDLVPEAVAVSLRLIRPLPRYRSAARETDAVPAAPRADVEAAVAVAVPVVAAMMRLQLLLGLRPGEVYGLRRRMVKGDVLDYEKSHKMAYRGRPRVVPLSPAAKDLLRPWLAGLGEDDVVFKPVSLVRRVRTVRYDRTSYRQAVRLACEKASVPPFSPNQIRHRVGFDTRAELGLDYAQALLGHGSAATTERFYAPVDLDKARRAVEGRR